MSRNLAHQILRASHSACFAMVLTAGFYCDSRAHDVRKVRVVKYIVVYGQIKAAEQKYCHNQRWRRKLKEIMCSRSVLINRINSKFFKRGKEEYAFSVDKKTHDRKIRLCTYLQRWL